MNSLRRSLSLSGRKNAVKDDNTSSAVVPQQPTEQPTTPVQDRPTRRISLRRTFSVNRSSERLTDVKSTSGESSPMSDTIRLKGKEDGTFIVHKSAKPMLRSDLFVKRTDEAFKEGEVTEDVEPPSQQTTERSLAARMWLEDYFDTLMKATTDRQARVVAVSQQLENSEMSSEQREEEKKKHFRKESDYIRLRRKRVTPADFRDVKIIGKGAFGVVKLVQELDTGRLFAMKVLLKSEMIRRRQEGHVRAERDLLASAVNRRSIVKLYRSFQDQDNLYLVLEYMAGGDLLNLLIRKKIFPEPMAKFYMAEMILSIREVHNLGYIHRDVKPDNFLLDGEGHLKVSDFGLCTGFHWRHDAKYYEMTRRQTFRRERMDKQVDEYSARFQGLASEALKEQDMSPKDRILDWRNQNKRQTAYSVVGTNNYIAPEVLLQVGYNKDCDYWSLGVILFEMLYGYPPFYSDSRDKTKLKIVNWRKTLRFPQRADVSHHAQDLIEKLLCDPKERLGANSAEEVMNHPFFDGIDWDNIYARPASWIPDLSHATDTKYFDSEFGDTHSALQTQPPAGSSPPNSRSFIKLEEIPFYGFTHRGFYNLTRKDRTEMDALQAAVLEQLRADSTTIENVQ